MLSIHQHSRLTAAVAAILLMISSSGFTAVLHSCLMPERSCCDKAMMAHMAGDEHGVPGKPILKNNMSCCAVTVAGGLNTNPIVTENQHSTPHHLDLIALLPLSMSSGAQEVSTHSNCFFFCGTVSPPSVEKYILNATFLI